MRPELVAGLLKAAADALRPPGPDVDGRRMGDGNYINRLIDWIVNREESETARSLIVADLDYLGNRLDAADKAGQKGAHASVDPVRSIAIRHKHLPGARGHSSTHRSRRARGHHRRSTRGKRRLTTPGRRAATERQRAPDSGGFQPLHSGSFGRTRTVRKRL